MAKRNSGDRRSKQEVTLLNAKDFVFTLDGKTLNVEDATDAEFDRFIREHIEMGWSLEDRVDAVNLALEKSRTLALMLDDSTAEKSNADLIFSGTKTASEEEGNQLV